MTPGRTTAPSWGWLGSRSIRFKILAGYGLLLLFMAAMVAATFVTLRAYSDTGDWIEKSIGSVALMTRTTVLMLQQSTVQRNYLLTGDEAYLDEGAALNQEYRTVIAQLGATSDSVQAQRWLTIQRAAEERREEYIEPGIELRRQYEAGQATIEDIIAYVVEDGRDQNLRLISDTIGEIEAQEYANLRQRMAAVEAGVTNLRRLLVVSAVAIVVMALVLARTIVRDVSTPINRIAAAARDIAGGNLDRRIGLRRGDELGHLAESFDVMADRVQELVQVQEASLQAIQEQKSLLQSVMDNVPVGVILIGADNTVKIVNQPMGQFLATQPEHLVGMDMAAAEATLLPGGDQEAQLLDELIGDDPDSERTSIALYEIAEPEPRGVEIYTAPVPNAAGGRLGRIYTVRDVTREQENTRMVTEFVSMVAHDLRTPLTSVKGYVDLVREGEVGDVNDEQRGFLDIVAASTDRVVALINDLLDMSRIEAGKVELERQPVDLRQSVESVAAAMRPQIEAKRQQVKLDLPDDLPVPADPARLAQILTNLLSNAVKYTPEGGTITLSAETPDDMVRVNVSDTGIGMSQAEQAQLFNRFFRSTNRLARQAGGTGLGLVITRSLVELHGGTISVRSRPGHGSTFSFTLPRETAAATPASAPPAPV